MPGSVTKPVRQMTRKELESALLSCRRAIKGNALTTRTRKALYNIYGSPRSFLEDAATDSMLEHVIHAGAPHLGGRSKGAKQNLVLIGVESVANIMEPAK
jgi:hypothetical protein